MRERAINLNSDEVRAILVGRKTQMRRVIKPQPLLVADRTYTWPCDGLKSKASWAKQVEPNDCMPRFCPLGKVGDRLWVRENFEVASDARGNESYFYRADWDETKAELIHSTQKWESSHFMPRQSSRITLEITGIRVERVQDISDRDAYREGMRNHYCKGDSFVSGYAEKWDSIHAKRGFGWDKNPWVWVLEFKRVEE